MGCNLVTDFDFLDVGIASTAAATVDFSRCTVQLTDTDFDGSPTCHLEAVGANSDASNAATLQLMYWTGSAWAAVDATNAKVIFPASSAGAITLFNSGDASPQANAAFSLISGTTRYCIRKVTAGTGALYVATVRLVIDQTDATKSVFQVPLVADAYNTYTASDAGAMTDSWYTSPANTWGQLTPNKFYHYVRNDAAFGDSIAYELQTVRGAGNASYAVKCDLYNVTDAAEVYATPTTVVTTAPVPMDVHTLSEAAWHDGDTYEIRSSTAGATSARACNLYSARMYVKVTSLTKGEVYRRVSKYRTGTTALQNHSQRLRLEHDSYSTPVLYWEATGSCADNANALILCDDATADTGVSGWADDGTCNWTSATHARWRSAEITKPTSGYRMVVRFPATTAASVVSQVFAVVAFGSSGPQTYPVAGTVDAASGTSGAVNRKLAVAGAQAATSGTTGAVTITRASASETFPVAGVSNAVSGATGAISVKRRVAGTVAASSGASGAINLKRKVAGVAAASSGTAGAVNIKKPVAGPVIAAVSGTSGAISRKLAVSGQQNATSGSSGAISIARAPVGGETHPVAGTTAAASGTTGAVTVTRAVSGTVAAVSGTFGAVTVTVGEYVTYPVGGRVDAVSGTNGRITITLAVHAAVGLTSAGTKRGLTSAGAKRGLTSEGHERTPQ